LALETVYEKLMVNPGRTMRFIARDGTTVVRTAAEMHADVVALIGELRACGLGAGDPVGVLGPNTYEWVLADLALLALRCVPVAVSPDGAVTADSVTPDSVAAAVERYGLVAALVTGVPALEDDPPPGVAALERRPLALTPLQRPPSPLPPEVATVVFSSGTAGTKKGLMLTDPGIMNTVEISIDMWELTAEDDILVVLPFSNFQQRYLVYTAIWAGCSATVVAPERMFLMMRTLAPTVVLGPPSFFELPYNRLRATPSLGRSVMDMYGPRVRLMFTGSAPIPPRMVEVFQELGAPLFEIYGSTESGWIACNLPGAARVGVAGRPVPGVEVEIADDGEVVIAVDRPQAVGYVFDGVETQADVFRTDGRIATGDLGTVDDAGFLRLTGRKKNVIITRSGVKINPETLESAVEAGCPGAKAVVVSGADDGRLTAVVFLDDESRHDGVRAHVEAVNRDGEASHRIADVVFRPSAELSVENGLLTRNLKVDRQAVVRTLATPAGVR
jgi:long-subunit acyl-CoA synthetase (AMP-forming)